MKTLIIFIVVALLAGVGWFVYQNKNQDMPEKEQMIVGMIKTLAVRKTADAAKIREYEATSTLDGVDKETILKMSDAEILEQADMGVRITKWTEAELRSPDTKFTREGDTVTVTLKNGDEYFAYKVNGIWY